jgi:hypothetical protein
MRHLVISVTFQNEAFRNPIAYIFPLFHSLGKSPDFRICGNIGFFNKSRNKEYSMKNLFRLFGVIAIVAVIGFSFAACGDSGDDGDTLADPINGTWKDGEGGEITLNKDSSFVISDDNKQVMRGTYTATADSITMTVKELHGDFLNKIFEEEDIDITFDNSTWYNKNQVIDSYKKWMKDNSISDENISTILDGLSADFDAMFPTMTGTVNDNTMIVDGTTFTKNGGGNNNNGSLPTILTSSLPNGTVGTAYNQTLTATGDTPITWSRESGTLPAGLTLSPTGVISGTPTTAATSSFTVKATNAKGNNTKMLTITIAAGSSVTINGWTAAVDMPFTNVNDNITTVDYCNNKFIAGSFDAQMAYSSDGVTWTVVGTFNRMGTIDTVAYGNGTYVAGGLYGRIMYSTEN